MIPLNDVNNNNNINGKNVIVLEIIDIDLENRFYRQLKKYEHNLIGRHEAYKSRISYFTCKI